MAAHPPAAPRQAPSREAAPPPYTAPPGGARPAHRQLDGGDAGSSQPSGQRQLNGTALHSARPAQPPLDGAAAGGARPRLGWLQRLREPAPADAAGSAASGRATPTGPYMRPRQPAPVNAGDRAAHAGPHPAPVDAGSSLEPGGAAPPAAQPAPGGTPGRASAGRPVLVKPHAALGGASLRRQPRPWDSHLAAAPAAPVAAPDRPPGQRQPAIPAPQGTMNGADAALLAARAQPHAESVLPATGPYGRVPVYGRSVESILAAVAAERRGSQGSAEGLDALAGFQGPGGGDDDALDLAFDQLPRWSLRGDSHTFDWSGATNYTALHLQARLFGGCDSKHAIALLKPLPRPKSKSSCTALRLQARPL